MTTLTAGVHGYGMGYVLRKYERNNCVRCNRNNSKAEP